MAYKIPWDRYATIAYLSDRLQDRPTGFGKTALQKVGFLLQEVFKVPLGYRFTLYNYGPYSSQLTADLEFTRQLGGVRVDWVPDDPGAFQITPGERYQTVYEHGRAAIANRSKTIEEALNDFGQKPARELELITTAIYVNRDPGFRTEEALLHAISELKPYFSKYEIQQTICDLRNRELIELHKT